MKLHVIAPQRGSLPLGAGARPMPRSVRRPRTSLLLGVAFASLLSAPVGTQAAGPIPTGVDPREPVFVIGNFDEPIFVTHDGSERLYVVEKDGRVIALDGSRQRIGTYLGIAARVGSSGSEQGLLGLAFHPQFRAAAGTPGRGLIYVNYTDTYGDTVISEFRVSDPDATSVAASTERVLMRVDQPYSNHNAGWIGFRAQDDGDYLYIATGDGGSSGDPGNRAQRLDTLLGKILRIDPLDPDGSGPRKYAIPPTNPFVGSHPGKDAIWSYGLRNPWRCSFDRVTGKLWCGDVGQNLYEEIDRSKTGRGLNYGWKQMEGRHCYVSGCSWSGKTLPIAEYRHTTSGGTFIGCAVTGGYVARRDGAPLEGRYIYGDYCTGRIWTISASHQWGDPIASAYLSGRMISSFGEDREGRIYLTDLSNGGLYLIDGS